MTSMGSISATAAFGRPKKRSASRRFLAGRLPRRNSKLLQFSSSRQAHKSQP